MSEKTAVTDIVISDTNKTTMATTDTSMENKTDETSSESSKVINESSEISQANEAPVEATTPKSSENVSNVEAIATKNATDQNKIPESHQSIETNIDSASTQEISSEMDISTDVQVTNIDNADLDINQPESIASTSSKIQSTNMNDDEKMEKQSAAIPTSAAKQQKPHIGPSIGSLGLLNQYASSSDEDENEDSSSSDDDADSESESDGSTNTSNNEVLDTPATDEMKLNTIANNILNTVMSRSNYRVASSDSSDLDSDDSDIECVGSIPPQTIDITNDEELHEFLDACEENVPAGQVKAKGELGIKDLPPIQELTITVGESECVEMGKISGIVDTLVLVESLPGFAAVDIDTVLFLDKGNRTLGQVFDVMGNVSSPIYCVRFNTEQDIQAKNIKSGLQVYVAPQTEYTNFIVLSDLMKQKGCDASWENDHEAPDDCNEYSDDEKERIARRQHNQRQRNRNRTSESTEQLPNKVTVKNEPATNTNSNPNRKVRRPKFNRPGHTNKPPPRFYKDNRGYSNAHPASGGLYHQYHHQHHHQQQQQHHQQIPPLPHYSWHTAAIPSTSIQSMPHTSYTAHHGAASNIYPNPFAIQANQQNADPLNLQSFPPLPPPMTSLPPFNQSPYNRKNSNSYQQQ